MFPELALSQQYLRGRRYKKILRQFTRHLTILSQSVIMFYEPIKKNHGLPKNPFNSLVIPRPIGWITSRDPEGVVNLAPYSFFNAVCYSPPL